MNYLARILSFTLHPLLMPMYILFFIFYGNSMFALIPWTTKLYCLLVTFITLFVLPLLSLPVFKYFHLIDNYSLLNKHERVYPILVAVVSGFIGFGLLSIVAYTEIIQQLFLVLIILLSVFSSITIWWKISMHMTAIGGFCGFVFFYGLRYPVDVRLILAFLILFAGALGSSRLFLDRHTPTQVYAGFLLGFLLVLSIFI